MIKHNNLIVCLLLFSVGNIFGHTKKELRESIAYENRIPDDLPVSVFLADPDYTIDVSFKALILQPTTTNMHYAAEALPLPVPTPNWVIHDIKTDYKFGFDFGLARVFHSLNTMLSLNWERFCTKYSNSVSVPTQDMLGPFFTIGPDASPYTSAKGTVHFHFTEIHVDYGMLVNYGNRLCTNMFAGLSYTFLNQTLISSYSNTAQSISRSITVPSRFSGVGPQGGMHFIYNIVKDFNLTGEGIGTLLIGSINNNTTYRSISPLLPGLGINPPNTQTTSVSTQTHLVPAFKGALGLSLLKDLNNRFSSCIEAGYKAEIYLDVIQSVDMGSEVPLNSIADTTVGVYARTFQRNLSNFALAGPYINLELKF
ncbi:MAG: hypothetical protein S4CHLAM20_10680 [Chlamydiia bacterium]|nr:hypothetical protein [Chlamydiia bacterium]